MLHYTEPCCYIMHIFNSVLISSTVNESLCSSPMMTISIFMSNFVICAIYYAINKIFIILEACFLVNILDGKNFKRRKQFNFFCLKHSFLPQTLVSYSVLNNYKQYLNFSYHFEAILMVTKSSPCIRNFKP